MNQNDLDESDVLKSKINSLNLSLQKKQSTIDSIVSVPQNGKDLYNEIKPIFPQITSCTYSGALNFNDTSGAGDPYRLVVLTTQRNKINILDRTKLNDWLKNRLKTDKVKLIIDEN